MKPKIVVVCLLLILWTAGCTTRTAEDRLPSSAGSGPFEATFSAPGLNFHLVLGSPTLIRSPTLGWELAAPLRVDVPGPFDRVYWLNDGYHVLRIDMACGLHPDPSPDPGCAYHVVSWEDRGAYAPFGIQWNQLRTGDTLPYHLRAQAGYTNLSTDDTADGTEVVVVGNTIPFNDGWLEGIRGATFAPEDAIPVRLSADWDDKTVQLVRTHMKMEPGSLLGGPEVSRTVPRVAAWQGFLHPGEDESITNDSVTVLDAIEGLRQQSATANAYLASGGCIQMYAVFPGRDMRNQPEVGLKRYTYTFDVVSSSGAAVKVILDREDTPLGTNWTNPEERNLTASVSCADVRGFPVPTVRFQDAQELMSTIQVDGTLLEEMFVVAPFKRGDRWLDPEQSHVRYEVRYDPGWFERQPEGGTRFVFHYSAAFDPVLGEMLMLMISPEDAQALDATPPS